MKYSETELGKRYIVDDMGFKIGDILVEQGSYCEVKDISLVDEEFLIMCKSSKNKEQIDYLELSFERYFKLTGLGVLKVIYNPNPLFKSGEIVREESSDEYCVIQSYTFDSDNLEWHYKLLLLKDIFTAKGELKSYYICELQLSKLTVPTIDLEVGERANKYTITINTNICDIKPKTEKSRCLVQMASYINSTLSLSALSKLLCVDESLLTSDRYEEEDLIDMLIETFENGCYFEQDEVCVNDQSEHCADFVDYIKCGKCKVRLAK